MILMKLVFNLIRLMVNTKILTKRTKQNKVLTDKALEIASNPEYDGYQRGPASMVYMFFNKKFAVSGVTMLANKSVKSLQLANELHEPIIRKFKRRRVYLSFKYNI